jgi:hypothetical protein
MKPIRLSIHARERAAHRGASEQDIVSTIRDARWHPTREGRFEARSTFPFRERWNGRWYATKHVRAISAEREDCIVVVTVYVYYGGEETEP